MAAVKERPASPTPKQRSANSSKKTASKALASDAVVSAKRKAPQKRALAVEHAAQPKRAVGREGSKSGLTGDQTAAPRRLPLSPAALFLELRKAHPDAHCELDHSSPFQLLVATVLSAQSTDVAVNRVTQDLFHRYPDAASLAKAEPTEVEALLNRIGMYRQKTKNIIKLSQLLVSEHAGQVPPSLDKLVALPGVGRKTANVVLGVAFGKPEGVVVDTHVMRLAQRLGWSEQQTPEKIEADLMGAFPESDWDALSHTLIFHGRRVCAARKPACAACSIHAYCPSAFHAENVGRKGGAPRTPAPPQVQPKRKA